MIAMGVSWPARPGAWPTPVFQPWANMRRYVVICDYLTILYIDIYIYSVIYNALYTLRNTYNFWHNMTYIHICDYNILLHIMAIHCFMIPFELYTRA